MAFGPSTDLLQQALLMLLQGQKPSPLAPVPLAPTGGIGPLAAPQPEPVPPALPGPIDADAIRARFGALAGPEPVAPVAGPDPLILKIARALQGFGAGVQGQGPQFLAQLQEQRERPQREFRAQKERFETRRQELGLLGEQAVLSAEERRAQRTTQLLDKQADRDFEESVKRAGLKSAEAIARMRAAFDLERDAKKAEFERLEQERKDAKERKVQISNLANTLTDDFKISRQQARRFAEHELNDIPLSAADAKQYGRIEKYRRPVGGTGAREPRVMVEIINPDGSTRVVPYSAVHDAIESGQISSGKTDTEGMRLGPRGIFMEGQQAPAPPPLPAIMRTDFVPGQDSIFGGLPAPAPTRAPSQPAQDRPWTTRAKVEAEAKKRGVPYAVLEADIRSRNVEVR